MTPSYIIIYCVYMYIPLLFAAKKDWILLCAIYTSVVLVLHDIIIEINGVGEAVENSDFSLLYFLT